MESMDPTENRYKETFETWNKVAELYQEKFMDLDLYNDTYDLFCSAIGKMNPAMLEVGCGPGNITKYLLAKRPDFVIHGIDISPNMVELARKNNPEASFSVMDVREIDQLKTRLDAIICGFCVPYLSETDLVKLIQNCAGLLSDDGILYLSFVDGSADQSGYYAASSGDRTYFYYHQSDQLLKKLEANHFRKLHILDKEYSKNDGTQEVHTIFIAQKITN